MNSLPINSKQPQAAAPGALPSDDLATDAQTAGPFAFLLARQVGDILAFPQDAAFATDSATDQPLPGAQNPATEAAADTGDPAGIVSAILQQLPVQSVTGQESGEQHPAPPFVFGAPHGANSLPARPGLSEDPQATRISYMETLRNSPMTIAADAQTAKDPANNHSPLEALKRTELPVNLPQPGPSGAVQTIAAPPMNPVTPGAPANNMPQSAATATVTTPVGQHGWADEFSQKISWIATQQNQVAELRLNPPNLGPLDVVLRINDNQATAVFTSPHGAVRDAVENALPKLREILADNGIMLGNATVSDHAPRDRSMEGFAGQGFGQTAEPETGSTQAGSDGMIDAAGQTAPTRRHNGMVDTFA